MVTKSHLINECKYQLVGRRTKAAQSLLNEYGYAKQRNIQTIWEAYKSCSSEKERTWKEIAYRAHEQGARTIYISGKNSNFYSTIYRIECIDDETGEIIYALIKDTYCNTYVLFYEA